MGITVYEVYENDNLIGECKEEAPTLNLLRFDLVEWLKENKFPDIQDEDVTVIDKLKGEDLDDPESFGAVPFCRIKFQDNEYSLRLNIW